MISKLLYYYYFTSRAWHPNGQEQQQHHHHHDQYLSRTARWSLSYFILLPALLPADGRHTGDVRYSSYRPSTPASAVTTGRASQNSGISEGYPRTAAQGEAMGDNTSTPTLSQTSLTGLATTSGREIAGNVRFAPPTSHRLI